MALWEEATDENGKIYYYNTETQETSWEKPVELPSDLENALKDTVWEQYTTAENEVYYYNSETKESSWEIPEEIKAKLTASASTDTVPAGVDEDQDEENIQELEAKYPTQSQIISKKQVNSITPKLLEQAKSEFMEMLGNSDVDSSWSFTRVMEEFIKDPRYWGVPDPLMKKELFESYLINKSEEEYKKSLNSKELFKSNFIKVLQNHDIKYYTRWKTCSNKIIDEPIYTLASEKLKLEIFNEYVKELRAEHDKAEAELKKQALSELEDYLTKESKLTIDSNFESLLESIKSDQRFKDNKHFEILSKLDILNVYDSVIKQIELEFNRIVKYKQLRKNNQDRICRQNFKRYLKDLDLKVTPKTTWFEFSRRIKDSLELQNLSGRSGSSAIDYYWDLLNESQQFLNAQKNVIVSTFLELKIDINQYDSFEKFKEILISKKLINGMNDDELTYIFSKLEKDAASDAKDRRESRSSNTVVQRDAREVSPTSLRKANLNNYKTKRDDPVPFVKAVVTEKPAPTIEGDGELDY